MDEGSSDRIPTNEEVIDELTKDVESMCAKSEFDDKTNRVNDVYNENSEDANEPISDDETERSNEENINSKEKVDPFYVDEEEIQSRDADLTDSEKETYMNLAEKLKQDGNSLFKEGNFEKATDTYTLALRTLPLEYKKKRAIIYANRAAAKAKFIVEKDVAIMDCSKAVELDPNYVKAYLRRAHLYEETEKLDEALEDFKKVLTFDPNHTEANCAIRRLPPMIEERNEKLKTEMMGKLKGLANLFLQPFGLSTDNFELAKKPDGDGYSVNFKQT